jgi:hypothetical protein
MTPPRPRFRFGLKTTFWAGAYLVVAALAVFVVYVLAIMMHAQDRQGPNGGPTPAAAARLDRMDMLDQQAIDRLRSEFPLETFEPEWRFGGPITSVAQLSLGESVGTDVFLFSIGEPSVSSTTKVGGIPYRPKNKPWPTSDDGQTLIFLAQYNFADSRDLVGDLPGDILLVFSKYRHPTWPDEPDQLQFEWYTLGGSEPMCTEVPLGEWTVPVVYGTRYRSVDYVSAEAAQAFAAFLPSEVRASPETAVASICRIEGMKIGGAPLWPPTVQRDYETSAALPGRFLCSLAGIEPVWETPYPWLNHPQPLTMHEACSAENKLIFWDGAILLFSIDDQGKVHWTIQLW